MEAEQVLRPTIFKNISHKYVFQHQGTKRRGKLEGMNYRSISIYSNPKKKISLVKLFSLSINTTSEVQTSIKN